MTDSDIHSVVNDKPCNEDSYTGTVHYGYTIGEKLGSGGLGVVYVGINAKGEKAAIKFLKEEKPEFISALKREAKIQQSIDDPGLLKVLAVHDKAIITEYQDGMKALDIEKLNSYDLTGIALQVIDVLERLHNKGVIHSDMKPGNILVTEDGQVKIADCGLAKVVAKHTNFANTVAGTVLSSHNGKNGWEGTPGYLPGNLEELKNPAPSLDILEFGKVLYQMIMGSPNKFPGMSSLPKLKKACSDKGLPETIADLVAQMTEEDKEDRIQDIAQLKRTKGYREIKEADGRQILDIIFLNKFGLNLHDRCDNTGHYSQIYSIIPQLNQNEFAEFVHKINPQKIKNHHDGDLAISMLCAYMENSLEPRCTETIRCRQKIDALQKKFNINIDSRMIRLNLFLNSPLNERNFVGFKSYQKYSELIKQAKSKKELDQIANEFTERGIFVNGITDIDWLKDDIKKQAETLGLKKIDSKPETGQRKESLWDDIINPDFPKWTWLTGTCTGGLLGGLGTAALTGLPDFSAYMGLLGGGMGGILAFYTKARWMRKKAAKLAELEKLKKELLPKLLAPYGLQKLAKAVKCCGGTEIQGADRQQIGEEVRKYTIRSAKQWSSDLEKDCYTFLEDCTEYNGLMQDLENKERIGVVTRFDVRKDLLRRNYCEMEITIYEKKNKIDEKIELHDILNEKGEKKPEQKVENIENLFELKTGVYVYKNPSLDEERDLMTEKPKPFAKKIKDAASKALEHLVENKISHIVQTRSDLAEVFLPPEQIKAIKGAYKESEKTEQPVQESLPEPKMPEPVAPVQEIYKEPEQPAVQETYKQPEQPIPVQEEPKQISQSHVQESYQKPEKKETEEESEDDEDERMLE